jgi:hypothetical protein
MQESLSLPDSVAFALKEWAVAVRALHEGRQIFLLRKGGLYDPGGEFAVLSHAAALLPTFWHEEQQAGAALQPCYRAWLTRPTTADSETPSIDTVAIVTESIVVRNPRALFALRSQHIYSETFLRDRIAMQPDRPLYAVFLRAYRLTTPKRSGLSADDYGCKSWITLSEPLRSDGAVPALSDHTYSERVRVIRGYLANMNMRGE